MEDEYNVNEIDRWISVSAAAKKVGITETRLRRALQRLRLPVIRSPKAIFLRKEELAKIRLAYRDGTIRPGRPKKKAG